MRVAIVHGRYRSTAPSGENRVVDQECAVLRDAGHHVSTFERHSDEISGWSLRRKAQLPVRSIRNPQVRGELTRILDVEQPDVVHVHNTFPLLSPSVLQACSDRRVPVVATVHNYKLLCASGDFFRAGRPCHECAGGRGAPGILHGCYRGSPVASTPVVLGNAVNRRAWRHLVSAYAFISAAQRDLMAPLDLPAERVFVKHNFVPEPDAVTAARDHAVSFVGRLDAAKGIPLLMAAWDAFRSRHPESRLRLVVAGGGPLDEEVRAWSQGHASVDVVGMLSRAEVASLVARSLAVVVPSQWQETFGLVAVEAMAAGVAPIAPASGSFPELVTDGVDGVLVEPGSVDGLVNALAGVDARPGQHVALGDGGRRTYERRFTPQTGLDQLLAIYRFAVANPAVR